MPTSGTASQEPIDAYPAEFIRDNLAIQTHVIHAAHKNHVKRLLFLGSPPGRGQGECGGAAACMPPLVNIGVGHDLTICELAHTVKEVTGYTGDIVFDAAKPDGTPRNHLNAMGLKTKTSLREDLVKAYADCCQAST